MVSAEGSTGRSGFVERHGLWTEEQQDAGRRAIATAEEDGIETIRLSFVDQHGILRGKTLVASELGSAMRNGCSMTSTLLLKDTSHRTVYPVWQSGGGLGTDALTGAGDFLMVPDPITYRTLPWAPGTGWMLCDIFLSDGTSIPFSTRQVLRDALKKLGAAGYDYVSGLEVEFHVFELEDAKLEARESTQPGPAPDVSLLTHGFQYLTESRADELEPVMDLIHQNVAALGLPVRSMEVEFGPSQFEFTFNPDDGLAAADNMVLFRSAVKQICRRNGLHASFMCRPGLDNLFSSGWHLHQSLTARESGRNAFMPNAEGSLLSETGLHFAGGLLKHAEAGTIFAAPTINGYKRYRPHSLAPDRIAWGLDNKGAMIRAIGGPEDPATRIENRAGEPAANPYLYMATQILAGLDGVKRKTDPGPPTDEPYSVDAPKLPMSLIEAAAALRGDSFFREALGAGFVDYFLTLKDAEITRFLSSVTDWEHREYFDIF